MALFLNLPESRDSVLRLVFNRILDRDILSSSVLSSLIALKESGLTGACVDRDQHHPVWLTDRL